MPLPREGDLPTFCYHHFTVSLPTTSLAIAQGTPISFARTPVILATTPVLGTTEFDVAAGGGDMTLSLNGIVQVNTGGVIAIGDPITFDATSRAILAAAGNQIFGRALDASTAAGQRIRVLITREGVS
jgi:hypothetical protein